MMPSMCEQLDQQADLQPDIETRPRVLLVSYHFPPVGGAGVQRPVKFVKYLRQFGWDVSVLMAANPSVPVLDYSLCEDIPKDVVIEQARTWEPGYNFKQQLATPTAIETDEEFPSSSQRWQQLGKTLLKKVAGFVLQPDPQVLWLPAAIKAGMQLLRRLPHDAILATAPPYSNLLLGSILKHRSGLPLVVDFRDEWDLSQLYLENSPQDRLSRQIQQIMQTSILRNADAIVATTKSSMNQLESRARNVGSPALTECIYNGFDPEDFQDLDRSVAARSHSSTRFRLVYTGTLWNLTDVSPLVEAVERIGQVSPELLRGLELVFAGRKTTNQQMCLERLRPFPCSIESLDYCEHTQALKLMADADAVCLLLSDGAGAERVVPAKLFEYLALQCQVLAVAPAGETTDILSRFVNTRHFVPHDVAGIAHWLTERLQDNDGCHDATDHAAMGHEPRDCGEFSRIHETGQLADLLSRVCRPPAKE